MNHHQSAFLAHDRIEAMKDEARRNRLLGDNRAPGDDFTWQMPARPSIAVRIRDLLHNVHGHQVSSSRQPRPAVVARAAREG